MIKTLPGPSLFWRCPNCSAILKKRQLQGLSDDAQITGVVTCGGCQRTYSYKDVYGGRFDLPEVELLCPHCSTHLRGPRDDLLGKPCPSCKKPLPLSDSSSGGTDVAVFLLKWPELVSGNKVVIAGCHFLAAVLCLSIVIIVHQSGSDTGVMGFLSILLAMYGMLNFILALGRLNSK